MFSKSLKLPKKECMDRIIWYFNSDKKIYIIKSTNSFIEFERGHPRHGSLNKNKGWLRGTLYLKNNEETIINIFYNRRFFKIWAGLAIFFLILAEIIYILPNYYPESLPFMVLYSIIIPTAIILVFKSMLRTEDFFTNRIFNNCFTKEELISI